MEKALEILKHIEELYVAEPNLAKLEKMAYNNPERVQAWEDAFREYDLSDILDAIDNYWEFKSSKSKPSVAHIKAILNVRKADKTPEIVNVEPMTDYAVTFMQRDIQRGSCRHLLNVYQKAVRYVAEDMLSQEMPVSEWRKLDFQQRQETALKRGLFQNFSDILVFICRKYWGKDYQFENGNSNDIEFASF